MVSQALLMHHVLPPVGGSLAPEDPYQELMLDPRVKNSISKKKVCTNKPTTDFLVVGPVYFGSTPLHASQNKKEINCGYCVRPGCVLTVWPWKGSGTSWIQLTCSCKPVYQLLDISIPATQKFQVILYGMTEKHRRNWILKVSIPVKRGKGMLFNQ